MGIIKVSAKGIKRIVLGHPWVFSSDVLDADCEPGGIADVYSAEGAYFGRGYYNPKSQITLRMLTRKKENIDYEFIKERVLNAAALRHSLGLCDVYRLINAESDFLPALIVDRFGKVLVMQSLSLGMETLKGHVAEALMSIPGVECIYERNDAPVRALEGMEQYKGFLRGRSETIVNITENGINIAVDIENGQKTGYFLDQRENRASIAPYVRGARVLDCFCHTGSFALHAAYYGASEVTGVDISDDAVSRASALAELNGLNGICSFVSANAFDFLRGKQSEKTFYDVIILDPPAFAKSHASVKGAVRGYKEINLRAIKLLKPGGILVSCSCSSHLSFELFSDMLLSAAADSGRELRVIEKRGAAKDHPYLLAAPETNYLKCFIMQVR